MFPGSQIIYKETRVRADPTEEGLYLIRILRESKHETHKIEDLPKSIDDLFRTFDEKNVHIFRTDAPWAKKVSHETVCPRGFLIAAVGIPCCGKSTVMRYFAAKLGASYYREPEEWKWPDAITYRDDFGHATGIMWFRSIRVPNLYRATADARRDNEFAIVDSYYDKMLHLYLQSPLLDWLISKDDAYYKVMANVAALDYDKLPNVDLLIYFKITQEHWGKMRQIRGRALDADENFAKSFGMQDVMIKAAEQMKADKGIPFFVFDRPFIDKVDERHPASIIADQLYDAVKHLLPPHKLPYT